MLREQYGSQSVLGRPSSPRMHGRVALLRAGLAAMAMPRPHACPRRPERIMVYREDGMVVLEERAEHWVTAVGWVSRGRRDELISRGDAAAGYRVRCAPAPARRSRGRGRRRRAWRRWGAAMWQSRHLRRPVASAGPATSSCFSCCPVAVTVSIDLEPIPEVLRCMRSGSTVRGRNDTGWPAGPRRDGL